LKTATCYVNIKVSMKSPAMYVKNLEVFANTIKMEPWLWMWLACLLVGETKIIQEGIHLLQQVQTFGIHGTGGVFG